jgi:hypothetical protein
MRTQLGGQENSAARPTKEIKMTIAWTTPASAPSTWANIAYGTSVSHTFTGLNGGTNYPSGAYAVVFLATRRNDMGAYSSVTIGGVTASLLVEDGAAATSFLTAWGASLPSGGADSVVATTSNTIGNGGYWSVVGALGGYLTGSATTTTATGEGTLGDSIVPATQTIQVGGTGANTTITVPSGGAGIACVYGRAGTAGTSLATPTWSGATADLQNGLVTNPDWMAMAHTLTSGSWGPSETSSPANASNSGMVALTFAAGSGGGATDDRAGWNGAAQAITLMRERVSGLLEPVREVWKPKRPGLIRLEPEFSI